MSNLRAFAYTVPSTFHTCLQFPPSFLRVSVRTSPLWKDHSSMPSTASLFPFSVSLPGTQCYLHDTLIYRLALLSVLRDQGILAALLYGCSAWRAVGPPYLGVFLLVTGITPGCTSPGICSQMDEGPSWSILRTLLPFAFLRLLSLAQTIPETFSGFLPRAEKASLLSPLFASQETTGDPGPAKCPES